MAWWHCAFATKLGRDQSEVTIDTASLIAPLGNAGRAVEIADRLTEAIHLGLFADGEHLPPEVEFAQHLGVAPMTLREAIAVLRKRGLVETRRGRNGGTFVKRVAEPPIEPDVARLAAVSIGELRDLADEQTAISGMAARLAAERSTARDLKRIAMLSDKLADTASRGASMKADSRFHVEIAIATRSERLLRREVALRAESSGLLWLPYLSAEDKASIVLEHRRIVDAIESEDGDAAQAAAIEHVHADLRRLSSHRRMCVDQLDMTGGGSGA